MIVGTPEGPHIYGVAAYPRADSNKSAPTYSEGPRFHIARALLRPITTQKPHPCNFGGSAGGPRGTALIKYFGFSVMRRRALSS
jgi:hypothetical protein